jgi:Ca-activated chloride channel family protein
MLPPAVTFNTIVSTRSVVFLRSSAQSCLRVVCGLIALISPHPIHLQAQQPTNDDEVVRVNTDLLVLPIRVKDKRGSAWNTLTERDLAIRDEDHATAGFYLYQGADRVALVFALDQSGSLREIVSQQSEAALALFGRFGERSQAAVIHFAEQPSLVANFGRDTAAVRETFTFPARANQHTAIFDAAAASVSAFDALPRVRSERRIVILISDGLDNASKLKAGLVIKRAIQQQVSFYVIHLPLFEPRDGRLAVRPPAKGFRELAEKTGGKYFLVGNLSSALAPEANKKIDLAPVFQAIEEDLRSQYLLGFYVGEGSHDGRKHRLTVRMPSGVEYQAGNNGYARTHEFFVNMPNDARQP